MHSHWQRNSISCKLESICLDVTIVEDMHVLTCWLGYQIMLIFKIMLFEKMQVSSKIHFLNRSRPFVCEKGTQQIRNEIQINMRFTLTCTLVLYYPLMYLTCDFYFAALHLLAISQKEHSFSAHRKTPKAG